MPIWLIIVLLAVSLLILAIFLFVLYSRLVDDHDWMIPLGFVSLVLSFSLILFVAIASPKDKQTEWLWESETHQEDIYSLRVDGSIEGRFFLGSGYVKEEQYYFYYVKTDKGYKLNQAKANGTYLVEDDSINPNIVSCRAEWSTEVVYTITIPVGTITMTYVA